MASIPLPQFIAQRVAEDALRNARAFGAKRGWKGVSQLKAQSNNGIASLVDPTQHLKYVEHGTKPFLMHWVEGKVVPIAGKHTNNTYFVKGGNVGTPGYVTIPAGENVRRQGGQRYPVGSVNRDGSLRVWRNERWRHPGIQQTNFQQRALDQAITQNNQLIKDWMMGLLRGES